MGLGAEYVNETPRNRMSFVRIFVEDTRSEVTYPYVQGKLAHTKMPTPLGPP